MEEIPPECRTKDKMKMEIMKKKEKDLFKYIAQFRVSKKARKLIPTATSLCPPLYA